MKERLQIIETELRQIRLAPPADTPAENVARAIRAKRFNKERDVIVKLYQDIYRLEDNARKAIKEIWA